MEEYKGHLRYATESDLDLLFSWANDKTVRENSFSTNVITYDEHVKWFKYILCSDDCKQYIYIYLDEPIGQVRVCVNNEDAELSYSVCKEQRCRGHAKVLLQLAGEQIRKDFPKVRKIIGRVKPDNISSQKAFLKAGYEEKYCEFELFIN